MEPVAPSATHFWRLKPANAFEIFWKFCAQNRIKNEMKKVRGEIALASRLFLSTKGWNVLRNSWNSGRIIPLGNPKKRVANDEVFDFDSLSPYCCLCVCVCVHTQSDFGFITRQRIMMTLSLHNNPARSRPELCQTAAEILLRRSLLTHLLQAYLHTHWHAHSDTFIPCLPLFLSLFLSVLADWSARGSQFPFLALFFACWVFYLARFFPTDSCFSLIEWNLGVLF